jgi:hypothetical protein
VKNELRSDWDDDQPPRNSAARAKLHERLTQEFHIPPWFWEKQGWDANGFFASKENPIKDDKLESSHSR